MPKLAVVDSKGSEVSKIDLSDSVFAVDINTHSVRAAVDCQLARRRQGTACTKNRAQVRGSGAKPWRQKGTGRARAGSVKSPIWRGGGTVFGPTPRQYGGKVNRKTTRQAILSCLSAYIRDGELTIIDSVDFSEPKTKSALALLSGLGIQPDGVLFLTNKTDLNLALSVRNLPFVDVINCDNLNTFDLTTHRALVATKEAIERLEEMYA